MRSSRNPYCVTGKACLVGALLGLLAACATGPEAPTEPPPGETTGLTLPGEVEVQMPRTAFGETFGRAESDLLDFDWMSASTTLDTLPLDQLSTTDEQYLAYLRARAAYLAGDQAGAEATLKALTDGPLHAAIASKVTNFRRYMVSMSGQHLESAWLGHRILSQSYANAALRRALVDSIWLDLQRVPAEKLAAASAQATDDWAGWLALATITAERPATHSLAPALTGWQQTYPTHPAAELPGGLGYLLERTVTTPKVTLMLPLSGRLAPAGKAVRDGYLARYYAGVRAGEPGFELDIVDVDRFADITSAYDEAVAGGTTLVIGPLSKPKVAALAAHANRPAPVIALNQLDTPPPPGTALAQLALAPEDEASQIAEMAFGQGSRRALVIRPDGAWGAKMEKALLTRWQGLGGTLVSTAVYTGQEDYSSSVAGALNLPASEQRARDVRSMLATNIEFTARRRSDVDVVFLLSRSGGDARSLKPLLAYHYAGDLPIYATSSIYRGYPDSRNADLNGVKLVETPWLLGSDAGLRQSLSTGGTSSEAYTRLNALGADAYLLQSRLAQLRGLPGVSLRGDTGLLRVEQDLRMTRELRPATFAGGKLTGG